MTDDEMRVAIGTAAGWVLHASRDQFINGQMQAVPDIWVWEDDEGGCLEWPELPDYLNDLNAMAEAEATLPSLDKHYSSNTRDYPSVCYANKLAEIVGINLREIVTKDGMATWTYSSPFESWKLVRATARQRALAFLAVNLK